MKSYVDIEEFRAIFITTIPSCQLLFFLEEKNFTGGTSGFTVDERALIARAIYFDDDMNLKEFLTNGRFLSELSHDLDSLDNDRNMKRCKANF